MNLQSDRRRVVARQDIALGILRNTERKTRAIAGARSAITFDRHKVDEVKDFAQADLERLVTLADKYTARCTATRYVD